MSSPHPQRRALWLLAALLLLAAVALDRQREGAALEGERQVAAVALAEPPEPPPGAPAPLRVLFVGNSLTADNDLPAHVAHLAQAAGEPRAFWFRKATGGGMGLDDHRKAGRLPELLSNTRFDAVVLQDQSQRPSFNKRAREKWFAAPARELHGLIGRAGGRTVLFQTFARREGDHTLVVDDSYERMQHRVVEAYRQVAGELGAELVPVGEIWQVLHTRRPDLRLWAKDGIHPSVAGTYLAACAFYAHFYAHSPVGNPYRAGLGASDAADIQRAVADFASESTELAAGTAPPIAWEIVNEQRQRAHERERAEAHDDSQRRQRIEGELAERNLRVARARVPIEVYTTAWCHACKEAIKYMRAADLSIVQHDIERDAAARQSARRLNPRGSVPTIDVDGAVLVGWNAGRFEKMLDQAAKKRM